MCDHSLALCCLQSLHIVRRGGWHDETSLSVLGSLLFMSAGSFEVTSPSSVTTSLRHWLVSLWSMALCTNICVHHEPFLFTAYRELTVALTPLHLSVYHYEHSVKGMTFPSAFIETYSLYDCGYNTTDLIKSDQTFQHSVTPVKKRNRKNVTFPRTCNVSSKY